ncbi:MAG: hypothetical protein ABI406_18680 [Ktedonobacteraceae bacterium]
MLKAIEDFADGTIEGNAKALGLFFIGHIAVDEEIDAYLRGSRAHRRSGRPRRYYVSVFDGGILRHSFSSEVTPDNPQGIKESRCYSRLFGLSAYSDEEAIAKANAKLEKAYAKFKCKVYKEQVFDYSDKE